MPLRPYQQRTFDAVIEHIRFCIDPCLVEAATGAGKSHIIASVAEWIHKETGKKVLITAPTSDLVTQDHEKYPGDASIFCASAGRKELENHVVFGSPKTILNSIDQFCSQFCAVIVDEGDGLTPTLKKLIARLREQNPNLRVIGFTATPFRMRTGYIYEYDMDNKAMEDTLEPYYTKLVAQIKAPELIELGYLSPPVSVLHQVKEYDTTGLVKNNLGFTKESLDAVYHGQEAHRSQR
jgi:DNA repair protein RadD